MNVIKGLIGFVGRSFIGLGLTLFIFSIFLGFALNNVDVLENSLRNSLISSVENIEGFEDLEEYCELNPDDENCLVISNPEQIIENDEGIEEFTNNIKSYAKYLNPLRIISVLLFLIGVILIYLTNKSFILTSYKVSFSSTITAGLAILYYKFIPVLLSNMLNNSQLYQLNEIPPESLNMAFNIVNNWLYSPLHKTFVLSIFLTALFLVFTIILYFVKKKVLNKYRKP